MSKWIIKFLIALLAATALFWIVRFRAWIGALTTVRTPFYFTMNYVLAWVCAALGFIGVMLTDERDL